MFETGTELAELQRLLDDSFERGKNIRYSGFNDSHRFSAAGLAGFQGVRLVACATVNSEGEPRAAPRSAALLHGHFYLAANSGSTMVRRLARDPHIGITYFENHLLIIGHGTSDAVRKGSPGYRALSLEWVDAFKGGRDALDGTDLLLRVAAEHLVAFATHPERYPAAWRSKTRASRHED